MANELALEPDEELAEMADQNVRPRDPWKLREPWNVSGLRLTAWIPE
jgi:hypothetical protein